MPSCPNAAAQRAAGVGRVGPLRPGSDPGDDEYEEEEADHGNGAAAHHSLLESLGDDTDGGEIDPDVDLEDLADEDDEDEEEDDEDA